MVQCHRPKGYPFPVARRLSLKIEEGRKGLIRPIGSCKGGKFESERVGYNESNAKEEAWNESYP